MRTSISIADDTQYHPAVVCRMFKPSIITLAVVPCEEWIELGCYNCDMVLSAVDCVGLRALNNEPTFCSPVCKMDYLADKD